MSRNCPKCKTFDFTLKCLVIAKSWNKIHSNLSISYMYNNFVSNLFTK